MGWVWRDDEPEDFNKNNPDSSSSSSSSPSSQEKVCSTRTVVKSQCRTEEVEPGKLIRKCEKTEEVLRECLGEPVEVLKSNKEYTEDDVTGLMGKGSSTLGKFDESPFAFPGLRTDIEGLERHFLGGMNRFFEAAEEMRNSIFNTFGDLYKDFPSSSPSTGRGIPIKDYHQKEALPNQTEPNVDLSDLAKDV